MLVRREGSIPSTGRRSSTLSTALSTSGARWRSLPLIAKDSILWFRSLVGFLCARRDCSDRVSPACLVSLQVVHEDSRIWAAHQSRRPGSETIAGGDCKRVDESLPLDLCRRGRLGGSASLLRRVGGPLGEKAAIDFHRKSRENGERSREGDVATRERKERKERSMVRVAGARRRPRKGTDKGELRSRQGA